MKLSAELEWIRCPQRAAPWGLLLGALLPLVSAAAAPDDEVRRDPTVRAIAEVMPAVVNIGTETVLDVRDPFDQMLREFWGPYYRRRPPETQYSLGSGVIIDESGYIVTNEHVVSRASRIWVKLSEEAGGEVFEAERVAGTARSDIALLKINTKPGRKLRAVRFAMDDDLLLGETVIALGNPFGLGGSASRGILSSKSRRPASEDGPLGLEDWLQTDAAINPGNSGGPLINLKGELIGLNVAVYRQGQGIGFAIPVRRVSEGLSELFSLERERWWFGARVRPTESGLAVAAVEAGSPAAAGGLRVGDVIESVNGRKALGLVEFNRQLLGSGDRKDVRLEVRRGAEVVALNLRLVRETSLFNETLIRKKLGISVQEITRELAERMGLATTEGLLIAGVDTDSEAERSGVRRGQIILRLDGVAPTDLVAAARMLHGKKAGEVVSLDLLVLRRAGRILVPERGVVELKVR